MTADPADTAGAAVPFTGLRRNALAVAGGSLLLAVVFLLVPDIAPRGGGEIPVALVQARVVELVDPGDVDPGAPDVLVLVTKGIEGGPDAGDELEAYLQGPTGLESRPDFDVGDEVIVNISTNPAAPFVAVADRYRIPTLALLLGVFAAGVTIVGGWRGVRSLIALALTLGVIIKLVVPLILAGWDPARRAKNVGRSHIAATVNTLVLAYVGASLPLIVLFGAGQQDPLLIMSGEVIGRRLPVVGDGSGARRATGWD